MVNRKVNSFFGILLMSLLMLGLVAGAGYNVVVPATVVDDDSSSSGGSSSTTTTLANTTDNETVSGDDLAGDEDGDSGIGDTIGDGVDNVKDFIRNVGLKEILILIVGLGIIGASVWYFLRDRRKGYVEVKVKKDKK